MDEGIKKKAITSVKWTSFYSVYQAASAPLFKIFLARFLSPTDFSYIAVVVLFTGIAALICNLGIPEAFLQRSSVSKEEVSSLFFFKICISVIVSALLFVLAYPIEQFYNLDGLAGLLQLSIVTILLRGSASLFISYLQKNLQFKYISIINMIRNIIYMLVTFLFVINGVGVRGYVIGTNAGAIAFSAAAIWIAFRRSELELMLHFKLVDLKPYLQFGKSVFIKQILNIFTQRMDEIIIGKFLAPEILGFYFFGKDLLQKPRALITQAFARVLLPLYSKLQNNKQELKRVYNLIADYILIIALPVFVGIAMTASFFVPVIFGSEWNDSIISIRFFAITSLFVVLTANVATSLLYSVKKQNIVLYIDIIFNSLYLVCLFIFSQNGIINILIIYSVYMVLKTLALQFFVSKQLKYSFLQYFINMRKTAVSAALMILSLFGLTFLIGSWSSLMKLIFSVGIGMLVYGISIWLFERKTVKNIIKMFSGKRVLNDEKS